MKCTDCNGSGLYQPLFGEAETCTRCNGSKVELVGLSGEAIIYDDVPNPIDDLRAANEAIQADTGFSPGGSPKKCTRDPAVQKIDVIFNGGRPVTVHVEGPGVPVTGRVMNISVLQPTSPRHKCITVNVLDHFKGTQITLKDVITVICAHSNSVIWEKYPASNNATSPAANTITIAGVSVALGETIEVHTRTPTARGSYTGPLERFTDFEIDVASRHGTDTIPISVIERVEKVWKSGKRPSAPATSQPNAVSMIRNLDPAELLRFRLTGAPSLVGRIDHVVISNDGSHIERIYVTTGVPSPTEVQWKDIRNIRRVADNKIIYVKPATGGMIGPVGMSGTVIPPVAFAQALDRANRIAPMNLAKWDHGNQLHEVCEHCPPRPSKDWFDKMALAAGVTREQMRAMSLAFAYSRPSNIEP